MNERGSAAVGVEGRRVKAVYLETLMDFQKGDLKL